MFATRSMASRFGHTNARPTDHDFRNFNPYQKATLNDGTSFGKN